jgi:hypothetical protein
LPPGDGDRRNEAVAAPGNVGDIAPAGLAIAESTAQRCDVNPKTGFLDEGVRPDPGEQLLFAQQLARPFDEGHEDIARAASEMDGRFAFKKLASPHKQTEGPESDDIVCRFRELLRHLESFIEHEGGEQPPWTRNCRSRQSVAALLLSKS